MVTANTTMLPPARTPPHLITARPTLPPALLSRLTGPRLNHSTGEGIQLHRTAHTLQLAIRSRFLRHHRATQRRIRHRQARLAKLIDPPLQLLLDTPSPLMSLSELLNFDASHNFALNNAFMALTFLFQVMFVTEDTLIVTFHC